MSEPADAWAEALERHRPALLLWARVQTPAWVRAKVEPADLVQQTLLEALRDRARLAGRPEHEVLAFLRRALTNNLIDAARKFARARGDISPDAASDSAGQLADWLAAGHSSPSERAARNERFARGLARLPDAQRVAVEMKYLRGEPLAAIARVLGRTEGAVSQHLHRAFLALREDRELLDA
jgi:RNA polymerase sigma-70 factor (ECF subfamily)